MMTFPPQGSGSSSSTTVPFEWHVMLNSDTMGSTEEYCSIANDTPFSNSESNKQTVVKKAITVEGIGIKPRINSLSAGTLVLSLHKNGSAVVSVSITSASGTNAVENDISGSPVSIAVDDLINWAWTDVADPVTGTITPNDFYVWGYYT